MGSASVCAMDLYSLLWLIPTVIVIALIVVILILIGPKPPKLPPR